MRSIAAQFLVAILFSPLARGQTEEAWSRSYDGPGSASVDIPFASTLDGAGGVHVAGQEWGNHPRTTVIHYDGAGRKVHEARLGEGDLDVLVAALATGQDRSLYLAAQRWSREAAPDIIIVRYAEDGHLLWSVLYDAANHEQESAAGLALDPSGNVYVAGFSRGARYLDSIVLKYSPEGSLLWDVRYDRAGDPEVNLEDVIPTAIAVDPAGSVFITGYGLSSVEDERMVTIKYDASGKQVWIARGEAERHSIGRALALDALGNVCVGGTRRSAATGLDYLISKYDASGKLAWSSVYDGPGAAAPDRLDDDTLHAVAVDAQGSILATGSSPGEDGFLEITTVKYSPDGRLLWAERLAPLPGMDARATAMAIDGAGSAWVGGTSVAPVGRFEVLVRYDPDGRALWLQRSSGPSRELVSMAVDAGGNAFLSTHLRLPYSEGQDIVTTRLDSSGNVVWEAREDSPGTADDGITALAVDAVGSATVTGVSLGLDSGYDYATLRYDALGNLSWIARFSVEDENSNDRPAALALGDDGSVVVTGSGAYDQNDFERGRFATVKYDPRGNELWRAYLSEGSASLARAVGLDPRGNVLVAGEIQRVFNDREGCPQLESDLVLVKYDSDGRELWVSRFDSDSGGVSALAVDAGGNAYVAGSALGLLVTLKFDSSGALLWAAWYEAPGYGTADAVRVDDLGNVSVAGWYSSSSSDQDLVTIRLDRDGNRVWEAHHAFRAGKDSAARLELDRAGNIIVSGTSLGADQQVCYETHKYDPSGRLLWEACFADSARGRDIARGLALDARGNIYVAGMSLLAGRMTTVEYDPDGIQLRVLTSQEAGDVAAIACDSSGNAFVAGKADSGFLLVKYLASPPPVPFLRGDADASGVRDISDAAFILGHLFLGEAPPPCLAAADVDRDGTVALTDAIFLLRFLFLGGPPPPEPFLACDESPGERLPCGSFQACGGGGRR
jgi:uncharacterized delta-60 repeat protein